MMVTISRKTFRRPAVGLLLACLLVPGGGAAAATLEGVHFPERLRVAGHELALRGAALLRYKIFLKAYVAGFYVDAVADEHGRDDASFERAGRRLEIEYFWEIPAAGFAEATREGIARNVDESSYGSLRGRIERLNGLYRDVAPGDRYALTYIPGRGTELALNGEPLGVIEGQDFASAVFAIWLGDDPLDLGLKRSLLGRS